MINVIAKSASWNPGARFILLFNNPDLRVDADGFSGISITSKFFELLYNRFNVGRVLILYASGIKSYKVYITKPYKSEKDCSEIDFTKFEVATKKVPGCFHLQNR